MKRFNGTVAKLGGIPGTAILFIVFLLGFAIRIYDLNDPPLDFHATRQLRSMILARAAYYRYQAGASPELAQKAQELAELEMYEPPIFEELVGATQALFDTAEPIAVARVFNGLFWLIGGVGLYAMSRRMATHWPILAVLAFYFFLPFSVIASRSFQPDGWMVMWIILSVWAVQAWVHQPVWRRAFLAGLLAGIAILVKGMAVFYISGFFMMAVVERSGRTIFRNLQVWAMAALALIPLLAYYLFLNPERTGSFFSFWTVALSGLVVTTNFYADWLAMVKGLMGLMTFTLALLGVLAAPRPQRSLLIGGWLGYGAFGLALPYQYTTHEYYHLFLVPLVMLSILPLAELLYQRLKGQSKIWMLAAVMIVGGAAFYNLYVSRSIMVAADYSLEPASWARVGKTIPEGKPFVALTGDYGMRLNYYGWRIPAAQWPSSPDLKLFALGGNDPINVLQVFKEITAGKDYFLVTAYSELDAQPELKDLLYNHHQLYHEGGGFTIFDLNESTE